MNLICMEDGIDSSMDAGKQMISVLSAVAEIERENIRIQAMEGRIQKAREGPWNGDFAPYGYSLEVNEEEAGGSFVRFRSIAQFLLALLHLPKYRIAIEALIITELYSGKQEIGG